MKHLYFMVTVSMVMFLSTIHAAVIHVPADYPTIQEGIDAAFDGDTVLVAAGTYTGHGNRDIELFSKAIMVQGSGPATCVINCENADYGFYFHHGELDTTIVSGFTIRASSFNGIRCYQSSPLIENCRIEDCHDGIICIHSSVTIRNCVINTPGTGFHCSYGRPLLEDCVMTNGTSSGVDLWYSRARMTRCTVSNNSNDLGGAGIKNWKSSLIMSHCLVENNELYGTDVLYGAGVFSVGDNLEMRHCVIRNNTIHSDPPYYEHGEGAGLFIQSNAQIENCLIRGNIAENGAVGGVYCGSPDYVTIQCCTIADNQGFGFDAGSSFSRFWSCIIWDECGLGANGEISYSNMLNPVSGIGIISEDPLFVSGPDGEYYLSQIDSGQGSQSPCVDAGANYAFEYRFGDLTMAQLTTRTDQIVDSGIIDLGYHYPAETMSPTPTQTPTQTPTCFPTSTPDPTPTPTAFGLGVDLVISQEMFTPGDNFLLQAIVSNPGPDTYGGIPLVVVMELYDTYFWYPTWSTEFTANFIDLSVGIFSMDIVDVTWPEMPGSGSSARIYGALLNEGFSSILGQWDMVAFGW